MVLKTIQCKLTLWCSVIALICLHSMAAAQNALPGMAESAKEPIKYIGKQQTDPNFHHGSLRHAVGVHRYQVMRALHPQPNHC